MANKLLTLLTLIFLILGMSAVIASDENSTSSGGGASDVPTAISANGTLTSQAISSRLTTSPNTGIGGSGSKPISAIITPKIPVSLTNTRRVCIIDSKLMKELNKLVGLLKEAEDNGEVELTNKLRKRIKVIKERTKEELEKCRNQSTIPAKVVESRPVYIDICSQIDRYIEKKKHYELLYKLSDTELKDKGYSLETGRERIKKIINELENKINRIQIRCKAKKSNNSSSEGIIIPESGSSGGESGVPVIPDDSMEAKPIAVSSGNEISNYYKVKISKIMSKKINSEERIRDLKKLRSEIDELIEELIKSKDKLNADEMGGLVDKIKIKPGIIEADDVAVNSVNKKLFIKIKNKNLTIEPEKLKVMIHDGDIKIKSSGLDIINNSLMINNSKLKLLASEVAAKLKLKTKEMELKKENNKLVYKIKSMENRRLFGLIPVDIENDLTVDAGSKEVNVLKKKLPWWGFLTVK